MTSVQIELPDELVKQLEEKGLLNDSAFFARVIADELAQKPRQKYSQGEVLSTMAELEALFTDESLTMEDFLEMKREELALEERKLSRL